MQQTMAPLRRERRPVPGSASFDQSNPIIYLGTVSGARKARARAGALLAPLDIDHEILRWPVSGLGVLLVGDPDHADATARLAGVLLRDGAERVVVIDGTRSPARIHRKPPLICTPAQQRGGERATVDLPNFD